MNDRETALTALSRISRTRADGYDDWLRVGMALQSAGASCDDWDNWSRQSAKYKPGDCAKRWATFKPGDGVTVSTLVHMAKEDGADMRDLRGDYTRPAIVHKPAASLPPPPVLDQKWIEPEAVPVSDLLPEEDLYKYLRALFKPDDVVSYVTDAMDKDGKYIPANAGTYTRTAGEIMAILDEGKDVPTALQSSTGEGGAWIRLNPMDGKGAKDENVTEYRHALVESDTLDLPLQLGIYKALRLPVVAVVHSGGKSLHAVVRIDAGRDKELFRARVDRLYATLDASGFKVDKANRNPSRLSRMPGVERGGKRQDLVCLSMGASSWDEWENYLECLTDEFPPFIDLRDIVANPPTLAPELIEGVLRRGHKMIFSGPSKAGKSFALIQLCVAISEGLLWFGQKCNRGRVLYINLELDPASCAHRFLEVAKAMQVDNPTAVEIWNLRGKSCGLKTLLPKLLRRMRGKEYAAVILDPLYMLMDGEDENSNGEMAMFLRYMDEICAAGKSSVIFASHFSKGSQGQKASIDRTAGAGVMARFPDAIVTLSEAEQDEDAPPQDGSPFIVEWVLREFARPSSGACWFRYPVHQMDDSGTLAGARVKGAAGRKSNVSKKDFETLMGSMLNQGRNPTLEEAANLLAVSPRTARRMVEDSARFTVKNGLVCVKMQNRMQGDE